MTDRRMREYLIEKDNVVSFPERLRKLRVDNGCTAKKIAKKIGISPQAYSRYEWGKVSPTLDMLYKISEGFGVSVSELLKGVNND